jgi:uncharacterized membrane protein YidH (DUF202 family)
VAGIVIGYVIIGIIVMLSCVELFNYTKSQNDDQEFSYSRRRLSLRLGIALLIIGIVVLGLNWPGTQQLSIQVLLLTLILLAFLVMLVLVMKDLKETSRSISRELDRLNIESEAPLRDMIMKAQDEARDKGPGTPDETTE